MTWISANASNPNPNSFADGRSMLNTSLPSAKLISNTLASLYGGRDPPDNRRLSELHTTFGLFVMQDLVFTTPAVPSEPVNISIPVDDVYFNPGVLLSTWT